VNLKTACNECADEDAAKGGTFGDKGVRVRNWWDALGVSAFYRGVELRAKTMSQMKLMYQKKDRQGQNYEEDDYGEGKKLNYLLQVRPNPMMTAAVLLQQVEIKKIFEGNAFVWIERDDDGSLMAFWLAQSGQYNCMTGEYTLTIATDRGPRMLTCYAKDVLHIANTFRRPDGYMGEPTLLFARRTLEIAATNDALTLENASKGGKMKLIVQEEKTGSLGVGRASKQQLEKITKQLNSDIYQDDVVLLNNVANVTPISQTQQQMEILSAREFSVAEIARLLGVPKSMLMDDSGSSYKTPEAATQEFMLRTIQPMLREWEDELNSKLLGIDDWGRRRFHANEGELMRLDPSGQAQIDKLHLETGVMSVNELRAHYDLPNLDEGDIHYVSTNLAELGSEKLRAASGGGESSEASGEKSGSGEKKEDEAETIVVAMKKGGGS